MSYEIVENEYKIRNSKIELTDYDIKLIKSIVKLRLNYANELSKRKCSIFLKEPIITSVFDKTNEKKEKKKKENKIECDIIICEAIQMNGKKCTAKSKPGEKFCGRHCKKN